jgi:hypothetical protein
MTTRLVQNPNQMKVLDLREELKRRGLSPSGLKSTLVKRLLQAMAEEGVNIEAFAQPETGVGEIYAESASFKGKCKHFALAFAISECMTSVVQVPIVAMIWFFTKDKDVLLFYEKGENSFLKVHQYHLAIFYFFYTFFLTLQSHSTFL